jgi:hypothetical protein
MEKIFKNNLSNYIKENTGYLEELKVANIFSKTGWEVRHSSYYLDRDENKGREIDVYASKNIVFEDILGKEIYIGLNLVCEVKKSVDKPWIIFSTEKSPYEARLEVSLCTQSGMGDVLRQKIQTNKNVYRNSSIDKLSRIGVTYCEAFKNEKPKMGSDYSQIFKALTSSIKASEYFFSISQNRYVGMMGSLPKSIEFFEPVIILSGAMYEAYLNIKNELELNEINHIPVLFNRISPKYYRHNYIIDVVTIKELPNLLTSKEKWINLIKENIQE